MEGSGKFLVTAVGVHSQAGIIFTLLGATEGTGAVSFGGMDSGSPAEAPMVPTTTTIAASTGSIDKATAATPLLNRNNQQLQQQQQRQQQSNVADGIGHRGPSGIPSGKSWKHSLHVDTPFTWLWDMVFF